MRLRRHVPDQRARINIEARAGLVADDHLNDAAPVEAIVLREREAWQNSKGGWMRTYGFADGHSERRRSDSGDYSAWEAEHQVRPKTGDPAAGRGN